MKNVFLATLVGLMCSAFTLPQDQVTDLKPEEDVVLLAKKAEKVPGYVVLKNGKRQEGKIIPGTVTDNELKVTFLDKSGKKSVYKPKDLLGYGFETEIEDDLGLGETEWIHYETAKADYPPKPFSSKDVFMQREAEGAVSLFCYYVEQRNNPKQPYKYIYYLRTDGEKMVKVEEKDFRKVSKNLFKDYTAMTSRIGRKDFTYKNLNRMVNDYNYWTANQHDAGEYRVAMKTN